MIEPAGDVEVDAVDDRSSVVALAQAADGDRRQPAPSLQDRGELAIEVGRGQLADLARDDDPVATDEVRLGRRDDPPGAGVGAVRVDHGSASVAPVVAANARAATVIVVEYRADDRQAVGGSDFDAAALNSGNSSRQGTHQDAQKLTIDRPAAERARSKACRRGSSPTTGGRDVARLRLAGRAPSRPGRAAAGGEDDGDQQGQGGRASAAGRPQRRHSHPTWR